ncbi:MAG TPA: hypothetical protein VF647_13755 [Longimicrobium sp.]|jgi:hypothetical protein
MSNVTAKEQTWVEMLGWLADAPLFIDRNQIGRFYDAVIRPEFETDAVTVELSEENIRQLKLSAKAGAEFDLGGLAKLLTYFPGLKLTAEAGAENSEENKRGITQTSQTRVISNPQRQLEHLIFHYLSKHVDRLRLVNDPAQDWWRIPAEVKLVPRQFVFLDLHGESEAGEGKGTRLIPTAAEFENGKIIQLYDKLIHRLGKKAGSVPIRYPEKSTGEKPLKESRREYWAWFQTHFSAVQAMEVVEEAASDNGRIRWVDYRLPLDEHGDTLHLHVAPACEYDTGTFAYNLIKRGFKHGIRLVGTLKSEPDMNVLAIYDK